MSQPLRDAHTDAHAQTVASAAVEADPLLGTVIAGRYRVLEKIGRGGMGAIYAVEHQTTHKRCAVKTLLPGLGKIADIARRFEREARAASLLDHPNIVSVLDFGALDDGALFLAMELVRGRSLGELMDAGGLPPARALPIARQVLEALAHAHRHGVIHRDLKPDNVMVLDAGDSAEERDLVKLLDFGIAKVISADDGPGSDKLTQAGIAFGTPDYMAPEQALGETVDGRADLYAMGVILFELLARRKPFVSPDKMAVLRMQVAVPAPTLSEASGTLFPAGLEQVVARALCKRREERFATAEEMMAALDVATDELRAAPAQASLPPALPPGEPAPLAVPAAPTMAPAVPAAPSESVFTELRRSRPFLMRVAVLGLPAVTLLVVLIVLAARGGGSSKDSPRGVAASALNPAGPSELAKRAQKLLVSGDAAGAAVLLDAELASSAGQQDPFGHLFLGHARAQLGRDVEALAAYERAVALSADLAGDDGLRKNVSAMATKRDKTVALAAVDFLGNRIGAPAKEALVGLASRAKAKDVRQRARAACERRGWMAAVDAVDSFGLDLVQGGSCAERRAAVPRLRATNDRRAIALLKRARSRTGGGFFGTGLVNGCLDKDAREAIEFLEALP